MDVMIKKLLIILIIFLVPAMGWSATHTVCSSGCDYTQTTFEALSGDYSNDTFYFSGSFSSELDVSIYGSSLTAKVTLDGWEGGTCNPPDATCTNAADFTAAIDILSTVDHIVIKDFDFGNLGIAIKTPNNVTVTGLEIRNCTFAVSTQASLYIAVIEDFVIDNNNFVNHKDAEARQNIAIAAAKRGRITNNKTYGGRTALIVKQSDVIDGTGTQSRVEKVVFANNEFTNTYEEGLSFDVGDGTAGTSPMHEHDTISTSNATTVTLSHAGWGGGDDPNYIGLYMIFIDGALAGRYAEITDQADAVFTLDTEGGLDFSDAGPGDQITISSIARKNYIGYNTVTDIRYVQASILLYGVVFESLIENNTVSCSSTSSPCEIDSRSLTDMREKTGSVTEACGLAPNDANLVIGNTVTSTYQSRVQFFLRDIPDVGCETAPTYQSYYNTALNNVLDSPDSRTYGWNEYFYSNGNVDGDGDPVSEVTMAVALDSASYKVYWPYIVGTPEISAAGGFVTITFSETVDVSGYTTGDAWVEDASENKINLVYSSGDDSTSITFSAASTIDTETTWYFWFNGADDSIEDTNGNDLVVYGFKPTEVSLSPPGVPVVHVSVSDDSANETGTTTGSWTLICTPTCGDPGIAVTYVLSGATGATACDGDNYDYSVASLTTITVVDTSQVITITACDDSLVENYEEIATLTLSEGALYDVGTPASGNIGIISTDGGTPIIDYGANKRR